MPDNKPKDYNDIAEWFRYFRLTKHLPAMPRKLHAAMKEAPGNAARHFVMTAYAAAALDIAFLAPMNPPAGLALDLEFLCGLKPQWLQSLNVSEIARPMKITARELEQKLAAGGFTIAPDGTINGFEGPSASRPFPQAPRL